MGVDGLKVGELWLVAPGGLWCPAERVLVIADLHVGYVTELRARGVCLPKVNGEEILWKVRELVARVGAETVVVAGDFVHGRAVCESGEVEELLRAVRGVKWVVVMGNHDRGTRQWLRECGVTVEDEEWRLEGERGGLTVRHGDEPAEVLRRERKKAVERGGRLVIGHVHPALGLDDGLGAREKKPAFVWAEGFVVLPAMAPLARGADVARVKYAKEITDVAGAEECETAVVVGGEVIRTGRLDRVRRAVRKRY